MKALLLELQSLELRLHRPKLRSQRTIAYRIRKLGLLAEEQCFPASGIAGVVVGIGDADRRGR
jgi:hypothetical protein